MRQQVTHLTGLRSPQQQAFALRRQPAILGHRLRQPLLDNARIGGGFTAPGLTPHLQLLDLDFPAHDGLTRVQVRRLQFNQHIALDDTLPIADIHLLDPCRHRRMQGADAASLQHARQLHRAAPRQHQHAHHRQQPQATEQHPRRMGLFTAAPPFTPLAGNRQEDEPRQLDQHQEDPQQFEEQVIHRQCDPEKQHRAPQPRAVSPPQQPSLHRRRPGLRSRFAITEQQLAQAPATQGKCPALKVIHLPVIAEQKVTIEAHKRVEIDHQGGEPGRAGEHERRRARRPVRQQ
ncbi:hypothetical protein D3C85_869090 [compost metagenome]